MNLSGRMLFVHPPGHAQGPSWLDLFGCEVQSSEEVMVMPLEEAFWEASLEDSRKAHASWSASIFPRTDTFVLLWGWVWELASGVGTRAGESSPLELASDSGSGAFASAIALASTLANTSETFFWYRVRCFFASLVAAEADGAFFAVGAFFSQ